MKELTDKEFAWLKKLDKETYKAWDDLNDWERKFMKDLLERFRAYGKRLLLTKLQWDRITEISEKIIG